jgi:hypothetical protein
MNDLHPLGVLREERQAILVGLDRNLGAIVEQLLARTGRVGIGSKVQPDRVPVVRRLVSNRATLDAFAVVNRRIVSLHNMMRVFILDGAGPLGDNGRFLPDGYVSEDSFLHMNDRAYDRLNRELLGILVNTPGGRATVTGEGTTCDAVSRVGSSCRSGAKD